MRQEAEKECDGRKQYLLRDGCWHSAVRAREVCCNRSKVARHHARSHRKRYSARDGKRKWLAPKRKHSSAKPRDKRRWVQACNHAEQRNSASAERDSPLGDDLILRYHRAPI